LNAHHEPIPFILPAHEARVRWELVLDTRDWEVGPRPPTFRAGNNYPLEARSLAVLQLRRPRARP
jgi:isoamylase